MLDQKEYFEISKEYTPVPFWFWNGDMNEKDICFQLKEMKNKGINEAIIHARKGLVIPYLSEEWFEKVEYACKIAKELGIKFYIYDEDNWPSGYAGGRVIDYNPDFAAKCLTVEKIYPVVGVPVEVKENSDSEIIEITAVYQDKEFYDITECGKNGNPAWVAKTLCWEVFVFRMKNCSHSPAYSSLPYVDLLNPDMTKKFVEVTHGEYKKRLKEYYGSTIIGFFTDEPGFYQNYLDQARDLNTIIWTRDFHIRFKKRFGYDIRPYLCTLWQDMGISSKIREDYYNALDLFYRESYFDVLSNFLHKDGLLSIGHLHKEDKLETLVQTEGDFYSVIDGLDYSGIDCIDRAYPRETEKLGASAQILLNKPRCLSETFGCFSWALTPQEIKERIDLQLVQGVNMFVLHAFFFSIEGIRVNECPPSLFFQNAYWKDFGLVSNYVAKSSRLLNEGKHAAKVALYYPSLKARKEFRPLDKYSIREIDESLSRIIKSLLENGIDFEFLPENAINESKIIDNSLIADHPYSILILPCPPDSSIQDKVIKFARTGKVYQLGETNGTINDINNFTYFSEDLLINDIISSFGNEVEGKKVALATRKYGEDELLFIVNLTDEENVIKIRVPFCKAIELWDIEENKATLLFDKGAQRKEELKLLPKQSLFLAIKDNSSLGKAQKQTYKELKLIPSKILFNGKEEKYTSAHLNGIVGFDGTISIEYCFDMDDVKKGTKVGFTKVMDFCSLKVNESDVGSRLWTPFEFDIGSYLRKGNNKIVLEISNTKSNAYASTDLNAGLLGEATLYIENN